jgi:predicted RNA-binding protein with RPS1 domain
VFVQVDGLIEGLMHVSETGIPRGEKPQDHFKEGDPVRARILRIDDAEMKVGLSALNVEPPASAPAPAESAPEPVASAEAAPEPAPRAAPEAAPAETPAEGEAEGETTAKKKRARKKPKDAAPES